MSFENHKWSENEPEAISEGLKFKNFLGRMPPDSPRGQAVTRSPFSPPKFSLSIILPPPLSIFLNEPCL